MESMTGCRSKIGELHNRLTQQKDTVTGLQEITAEYAQYQSRYDQARSLDTLKRRVEREAYDIQMMERAASNGFVKVTLLAGGVEFTVASLVAWLCHSNEHPLSVGARCATSWETDKPFGTVIVAIGSGGVPDDVEVIPLSQWAREQDREESAVTAALEARCCVIPPKDFFVVLDELKDKVLKGTVTLPAAASNLERHHGNLRGTLLGLIPERSGNGSV